MRWTTSKEESDYMARRQKENVAASKNSKAEAWMAEKLKETGLKWTRQARWGYRLFDFWNAHLGIAVEVDGPEHEKDYDEVRDTYAYLRSGIVVLRVRNFDEFDASLALDSIASSRTWKQRRTEVGTGRELVKALGLDLARSGREKLRG